MRKLKIQEFIIPARIPFTMPKVKPVLRLQGNWLHELGFNPGDYVIITHRQGRLVIEKEST